MQVRKHGVLLLTLLSLLLTSCAAETSAALEGPEATLGGTEASREGAGGLPEGTGTSQEAATEQVLETAEPESFQTAQNIPLPDHGKITDPVVVRFAGDFCLAEGMAITAALDARGTFGRAFRRISWN